MLEIVKHACRPTTGSNLRTLVLLLKKRNVDEVSKVDLKNQIYNSIPSGHKWKVCLAKEIMQIKNNDVETEYLKGRQSPKFALFFNLRNRISFKNLNEQKKHQKILSIDEVVVCQIHLFSALSNTNWNFPAVYDIIGVQMDNISDNFL